MGDAQGEGYKINMLVESVDERKMRSNKMLLLTLVRATSERILIGVTLRCSSSFILSDRVDARIAEGRPESSLALPYQTT